MNHEFFCFGVTAFFTVFALFALFMIFIAAGCIGSQNTQDNSALNKKPVSSADEITKVHYIGPSGDLSTSESENVDEREIIPTESDSDIQSYRPNFHAGMIIADEKENLSLVTEYRKLSGRYDTRLLLKGSHGEAYLIKDASFKELGSEYDDFNSINKRYPLLYDDLNYNSDTGSYYDYKKMEGYRIYIYSDSEPPITIGYLRPENIETMEFVNARA